MHAADGQLSPIDPLILTCFIFHPPEGNCTSTTTLCRNEYDERHDDFWRRYWALTEIPRDIPVTARGVRLEKNDITSVPAGRLPLPVCTYINLAQNKILYVHPDAFQGTPKLETLYLWGNMISQFEVGTFRNLPELRRLSLSVNELTSIHALLFAGLFKLESLLISNNKINFIEFEAFDDLTSLSSIALYQNDLTTLTPDLFVNVGRPLEVRLSSKSSDDEYTNLWDCSSLCWLKQEHEHGSVKWFRNDYPEPEVPVCEIGGPWGQLQCPDKGEGCLHAYTHTHKQAHKHAPAHAWAREQRQAHAPTSPAKPFFDQSPKPAPSLTVPLCLQVCALSPVYTRIYTHTHAHTCTHTHTHTHTRTHTHTHTHTERSLCCRPVPGARRSSLRVPDPVQRTVRRRGRSDVHVRRGRGPGQHHVSERRDVDGEADVRRCACVPVCVCVWMGVYLRACVRACV